MLSKTNKRNRRNLRDMQTETSRTFAVQAGGIIERVNVRGLGQHSNSSVKLVKVRLVALEGGGCPRSRVQLQQSRFSVRSRIPWNPDPIHQRFRAAREARAAAAGPPAGPDPPPGQKKTRNARENCTAPPNYRKQSARQRSADAMTAS